MREEKKGVRVGLRSGEELAAQTVMGITKRALGGLNGERFRTNGSVFSIIGMSFFEEQP